MKLLVDFFPILLFFLVFKTLGIYAATAVAIVATVAQIAWLAGAMDASKPCNG